MRGQLARTLRRFASYKPHAQIEKYVLASHQENGLPFIALDPKCKRKYYKLLKAAYRINGKTGQRFV